jgi:hypothetical protein
MLRTKQRRLAMRPRQFIEALENPDAPRCGVNGEQADMLRTLLVHLFFADLDLDKNELALLARVLPDVDIRAYVESAAARRLNLDRLAALFPDPVDRDDIVTLAEHAVWGDNRVDSHEWDLVDRLVEKLGVVRS